MENNIATYKDGNVHPLHNIRAEQVFLGVLILDNSLVDEGPDTFCSCHFAEELHQRIHGSINAIIDSGSVADPITISSHLKSDEKFQNTDIQSYLLELVDPVIGLNNIANYAWIIKDLYLRRKIIDISDRTISRARNLDSSGNVGSVIELTEKELYDLVINDDRMVSFKEALSESIENAARAFKRHGGLTGVTSGFKMIDRCLGGLQCSDLLILAGRPSMGKTAFATGIAVNAAKAKLKGADGGAGVAFFSLEMSSEQLATRILSIESGISSDSIRRGEIPKDAFDKFATISHELDQLELYIDDTPSLTVSQIRSRARKLKRKNDIGLIVIDYLQLINPGTSRGRAENRVQEISEITRSLKGLAKELNVPVLALSQLSREVEKRDDKKPQLSDLRESGFIEQDADVVMFVFREAYYKKRTEPSRDDKEKHDKWESEMKPIENVAEIIVAKQRQGPVENIELSFEGKCTRFGGNKTEPSLLKGDLHTHYNQQRKFDQNLSTFSVNKSGEKR